MERITKPLKNEVYMALIEDVLEKTYENDAEVKAKIDRMNKSEYETFIRDLTDAFVELDSIWDNIYEDVNIMIRHY